MGSGGRSDVDDRSATALNHARKHRPATKKGPGQVDGKHAVPCLFRRIQDGAVEEDGGAVEKHIDLAVLFEYGVDHAIHLLRLRDVHLSKACRTALGLDQLHGFKPTGDAAI